MGNICGKSEPDPFDQPGRVVGTAPSQPQRAAVPTKVGGPPRTLGGGTPGDAASSSNMSPDEARRKAAEAAEARAKASSSKPTGKLGTQLAAQKKQTRTDTLKEASFNELRQRDADDATQARSHN